MGSQKVRHDWATELNWTEYIEKYAILYFGYLWGKILQSSLAWQIWFLDNAHQFVINLKMELFASQGIQC